MIEAKIFHDGDEIGRIRFTKVAINPGEVCDYVAEIAVERLGSQQAIAVKRVNIRHFHRLKNNALALVWAALDVLDDEHFNLESDTQLSDLKRKHSNNTYPAWVRSIFRH